MRGQRGHLLVELAVAASVATVAAGLAVAQAAAYRAEGDRIVQELKAADAATSKARSWK